MPLENTPIFTRVHRMRESDTDALLKAQPSQKACPPSVSYSDHFLIILSAPRVFRLLREEHADAGAAFCEDWLPCAAAHSGSPVPEAGGEGAQSLQGVSVHIPSLSSSSISLLSFLTYLDFCLFFAALRKYP